ncbi:MAG: NADH:ubiquinone oxidoreductase [Spirochaetes bacterium]|nr:NADH:ubiquinone oxidoreductase [Spirochaetota bacterium]
MKWWPLYGIKKKLTEQVKYSTACPVKKLEGNFSRSLHIYTIDAGNCNVLNFDMHALKSSQYNTHKFGIYFTAAPRHADLLIVLGHPTHKMIEPLMETVNQMPKPYGIFWIKGCSEGISLYDLKVKNIVAVLDGCPEPAEILAVILKIIKRTGS